MRTKQWLPSIASPVKVILMVRCAVAALGPVVAGAVTMSAQQERPAGLADVAFEVASIKRNVSGSPQERWPNSNPAGQIEVINLRVSDLVQAAFQVGDHQVQGMPAWARNTRYDISARLDPRLGAAAQPGPPAWARAMQALLKERLQLASHREVQQRPVYHLLLARSDGKLGRNIRPAEFNCDALREEVAAAARAGQPSPMPEPTDTKIACGVRPSAGRILQGGGEIGFEFTAILSRAVGRPVFNRTGLPGKWDFLLTFTPGGQLRAGDPAPADPPDLFTALREQLGLKLEPATGPIDMFIVDRIEPPTVN
jgi:uncharacterized protein (TIGR03435 family)